MKQERCMPFTFTSEQLLEITALKEVAIHNTGTFAEVYQRIFEMISYQDPWGDFSSHSLEWIPLHGFG